MDVRMRKSLGQYRLIRVELRTQHFLKSPRDGLIYSSTEATHTSVLGAAQTGFYRNIYFIYNSMNCPTTRGGEGEGMVNRGVCGAVV